MSEEMWAQLIAAVVGAIVTVLWRLIDRYLPDPEGKHPLPPPEPRKPDAHILPVDPPLDPPATG